MLKRIFALCLVLTLGLSLCFAFPVSAAAPSEQQLVVDLGIVEEPSDYGLIPKSYNRTSFAHTLTVMSKTKCTVEVTNESVTKYASDLTGNERYATDVTGSTTVSDIINVLTMGYMTTDENGKFNPNAPITKNDVLVSLIKVLGYNPVVKANGGEVGDYLTQASKLGLLKGVTIADESRLTAGEVSKIVANAMGTPLIAYEGINGSPSCLWELWELSVGMGTIEANSNMGIGVSKVGANRMKINGTVLYSRVEVPNELVGAKVTYYMIPGERGNEVVSIYADNAAENITLDADEIESITDEGAYLEIIDTDEEKIKIDKQGYLMINGKVVTPTKAMFNLFDSGSATFLDTDEDGYYDVVHMTLIYHVVVEGVNADTMTFRTKFDKQTIDFSGADLLEVYSGKKAADFSSIRTGMVVGIACDAFTISGGAVIWNFAKGEYVRLYTSTRSEIGMIDSIDANETFSINDVKKEYGSGYKRLINGNYLPEIKLGYYVEAFYDNQGKLTYYEIVSGDEAMRYGYLIAGGVEGGSLAPITKLKIMDVNGTFSEFATSEKFILDGATVKTGSATYSVNAINDVDLSKRQLIRYRVYDGLVREVDTAVIRGTAEDAATTLSAELSFDPTMSGNSSRLIRSGAVDRRYAFTKDAVVFIDEAPIEQTNPSEELFAVQKASSMGEASYYLAGYDANDNNELACVVRYDSYGGSVANSRLGLGVGYYLHVVESVWRTVDVNGNLCWKITVAGESEKKTHLVPSQTLKLYSIDISDPESCMGAGESFTVFKKNVDDFESIIKTGDIIRYTTNSKDEIIYIEKLFDFASNKDGVAEVPNLNGQIIAFCELEKISGNNFIYDYGAESDGTTYISACETRFSLKPLYHVRTGKVEMVPFSEIPSAATGNNVKILIRYYNYAQTRDQLFYIYD